MTCKNCIHYDVCCELMAQLQWRPELCKSFKDKSLIVELPCKVGRFVVADINLFCRDCLRAEVRNLRYVSCDVVNIRYDRDKKAILYLRPLYNHKRCPNYHIFVPSSAMGKTVFANHKEAETKLKELNENE